MNLWNDILQIDRHSAEYDFNTLELGLSNLQNAPVILQITRIILQNNF
jgi:hypothetical protein